MHKLGLYLKKSKDFNLILLYDGRKVKNRQ